MPTLYTGKQAYKRKRSRSDAAGPSGSVKRKYRDSNFRQGLSIQHGPTMANQQIVKLRYVDVVTVNPGVGTTASHLFRANSIFDPDLTGTGHQPLGHDQWATFYAHYTVAKATISVRAMSRGEDVAADNTLIGVTTLTTTLLSAGTAGTTIVEQGRGSWNVLGPATGGFGAKPLFATYSPTKTLGIKDVADMSAGSQLKAAFGSNPNEDVLFQVYAQGLRAAGDAGNVDFLITIDYTCLLTEALPLTSS